MGSFDFSSYTLRFNKTFGIAAGSRNTTEAIFVRIQLGGYSGYGQASFPPYLTEKPASAKSFYKKVETKKLCVADYAEANAYVESLGNENPAACAALNMALADVHATIREVPVYKLLGLPQPACRTAFTIGAGNYTETLQALKKLPNSSYAKVKMGTVYDDEMIRAIEDARYTHFFVDVNAGWKTYDEAYEKTNRLYELGCALVEQPFPIECVEEAALLKETIPLPVVADESVKNTADLERLKNVFSGINIKLMKCGSYSEAIAMASLARKYNMQVLLGSMAESMLAVAATFQLASLADWHDLDAPLMIQNDPFEGILYKQDVVEMLINKGLGVRPNLLLPFS